MAEWNHRICERCYFDGAPGASNLDTPLGVMPDGVTYRNPVRIIDGETLVCCFCGLLTVAGIRVRRHENAVLCLGDHEDLSWARVGTAGLPT